MENTCRLKTKNKINVNDSGLRQALIENLFDLVGRGEAQVELRNQVLSFLICIGFLRQGGPGGGEGFNLDARLCIHIFSYSPITWQGYAETRGNNKKTRS